MPPIRISKVLLSRVPWFNQLTYEELPKHCLPRFPYKKAMYEGQTHVAIPGVMHAGKNYGHKLRSHLCTVSQVDSVSSVLFEAACDFHALQSVASGAFGFLWNPLESFRTL